MQNEQFRTSLWNHEEGDTMFNEVERVNIINAFDGNNMLYENDGDEI